MMSRLTLAVIAAAMLVAGASAHCTTDADCPSSYCVNYHGPPPYNCHACFDFCCETNADCEGKCTTGSYCNKYPGKHGPYFCHVPAGGSCNITTTAAPEESTTPESTTESADGFECWMCEKLLPYVGNHECSSKCSGWWPFLRGTCTSVCDELLKLIGSDDACKLAGYC